MSAPTLGELIAQGPAWETTRIDQLIDALSRSKERARDLREWLRVLKVWRNDADISPIERRRRLEWLDGVADELIRKQRKEGIAEIAAEVVDFDQRLAFLADVAGTEAGRYAIADALDAVSTSIGREAPCTPPAAPIAETWGARAVALLELLGSPVRSVEAMARAFDAMPEWLVERVLRLLGRLEHYDNYYRELAFALAIATRPEVVRAVARIAAGARTSRQTELLAVLARRGSDAQRKPEPPGAISPADAERFLLSVVVEAPDDRRDAVTALFDGLREHDDEMSRILGSYLATVPSNHEDVIDFLTRHGTRARGRALRKWGGPSVTISTVGSMRLHSPFHRGAADTDAPSPDFQFGHALKKIPKDSVCALIRAQQDIVFSLDYACLFSDHPTTRRLPRPSLRTRYA